MMYSIMVQGVINILLLSKIALLGLVIQPTDSYLEEFPTHLNKRKQLYFNQTKKLK